MIAVQVQQCLKDIEIFISRERRRLTHNLLYAHLLASLVLAVYRSLSCCERSGPWGDGFWETEVLLNWKNMGQQYPGWEEKQYLANYRMSKGTFCFLCERYGVLLRKQETNMRQPIPYAKRMAVILHWLAQSVTFAQLATMYAIAKCTSIEIVRLVPDSIKFPSGSKLEQVIVDFEPLCGMPMCACWRNRWNIHANQKAHWVWRHLLLLQTYHGHHHSWVCWWERYFHILCGRWKARLCRRFLCVDRSSSLFTKVNNREWLSQPSRQLDTQTITPFFAANSAFPLAPTTIKCYDDTLLPHWKRSFNYSLIHTRRVVEQAFGRLKGRWKIVDKSSLHDPVFARRVALVCCALHNVCERHRCPFEESWLPDPTAYTDTSHTTSSQTLGSAASIRNTVAKYVYRTHPCPWLCWYYNCYTDNIIILIVNNIHTTVATWLCYMYIMFTIHCNNNTRCACKNVN